MRFYLINFSGHLDFQNIWHKKTQQMLGLVPEAGVEPALQRNTSLSRARLPIPPLRHLDYFIFNLDMYKNITKLV